MRPISMRAALIRVLLSAVFTAATLKFIYAMSSDALLYPGYLIAWLFYPGGVHEGHGSARGWWLVGTCSNALFYASLWFLILSLLRFPKNINLRVGGPS